MDILNRFEKQFVELTVRVNDDYKCISRQELTYIESDVDIRK